MEEKKSIRVAADLAQAAVFDEEAPLLLRLQKVLGRSRAALRFSMMFNDFQNMNMNHNIMH